MTNNIEIILKTFRELQRQGLGKEVVQMQKISNMLGMLQNDEKYKDDILKFDEIFDEMIELTYILAEKYIKIGVALERAEKEVDFGGKNEQRKPK